MKSNAHVLVHPANVPQLAYVRIKKDAEIAARVDGRTKAELCQLAYSRGLDVSDLIREAVRDLLAKQQTMAPE